MARVYNVCMKRVNYHLPEQVIERLKAKAKLTGLTVSEIIHQAIDTYLENRK